MGGLASGAEDGVVRLWQAIWDPAEACGIATTYVGRAQVEQYLPDGWTTTCDYTR